MKRSEIEALVLDSIAAMTRKKPECCSAQTELENFGLDSLSLVFLLCDFEERGVLTLDIETLSASLPKSFGDLVDLICFSQKK